MILVRPAVRFSSDVFVQKTRMPMLIFAPLLLLSTPDFSLLVSRPGGLSAGEPHSQLSGAAV